MSVSLNVARAWAEAAYSAGHRAGVENPDQESINIDDFRPKRGKKSRSPTKKVKPEASAEHNPSCCDARVWNQGYGGQCSKSPLDGCAFCAIHQKAYNASLEKGGSDLRNGRYSRPIPERTLDGSDEKIPWKKVGDGSPKSPDKEDVKHPRPRGPAPKSESGGRKTWDGEVGQWLEPKVVSDDSETEDMSDEEDSGKKVGEKVEETVEETVLLVDEPAITPEEEEAIFGVDDEEVVKSEVASGIEIVKGVKPDGTAYEVEIHQFEPEPELEAEAEPEPAPAPETDLVTDLELGEDVPQEVSPDIPTIDGDILKFQGVDYMLDADDGMMYHTETYDEVGKYDKDTQKIAWNTKKFEMAHKKSAAAAK